MPSHQALTAFREAQSTLRQLRTLGVTDAELRSVLVNFGFGAISPDEFLSAKTIPQVAKYLNKLRPPKSN